MNEVISQLYQLAEIDNEIFEIKRQMGTLPEERKRLESELNVEISAINKLKEEREKLVEENKELEEKKQKASKRIEEDKEYLNDVKSNEEYMRVLNEIKHSQDTIDESGDILFRNLSRIEEIDSKLSELEQQSKEDSGVQAKIDEINEKLKEDEVTLLELKEKRESLVRHLPEDLKKQYKKIHKSRSGLAIVLIDSAHCAGCFSEIPEQLYQNVRQMDDVNYCINCGRILLWEKDEN
ncbi:MAG: C4-type zinc ribbon domain-containing protein [bacterium]